jgi:hypothetical protein
MRRGNVIQIRVSDEEKARIEANAREHGQAVGGYLRELGQKRVRGAPRREVVEDAAIDSVAKQTEVHRALLASSEAEAQDRGGFVSYPKGEGGTCKHCGQGMVRGGKCTNCRRVA